MKLKDSDFSQVFYVDKNGSNSNIGSEGSPFVTIDYAVSKVTQDNTLIRIGKGEFEKDNIAENSNFKVTFCGNDGDTKLIIKQCKSCVPFSAEVGFYNMIIQPNIGFSGSDNRMLYYGYKQQPKALFQNVVFDCSKFQPSLGLFWCSPNVQVDIDISFINCTFISTTPPLNAVNDNAGLITSCVLTSSTYVSNVNNCNIKNSITNAIINDKYEIIGDNSKIGVWYGKYKWGGYVLLIKKDDKYYPPSEDYYNEELYKYNELTDLSILSDIDIDDPFEYQNYLPDNKRPIDMFSGKIQLIKLEDGNTEEFSVMKSNRELVVAKDDIVNKTASTINSITLNTNVTEDGKLKLALSIDKGETWLTNSGGSWIDLNCIIPSKEYSLLNEEELLEWNNARDVIYENGIDSSDFNSINFNTLTDTEVAPDYIRFAYVIDRPFVKDNSSTTKMTWDYNSKGTMRQMAPVTEYDVDATDEQMTFTSKIDNDMIKINIEI